MLRRLFARGSFPAVGVPLAWSRRAGAAAYEAGTRRYRRRHPRRAADPAPPPSDSELTRWMNVVDRVLRSPD